MLRHEQSLAFGSLQWLRVEQIGAAVVSGLEGIAVERADGHPVLELEKL